MTYVLMLVIIIDKAESEEKRTMDWKYTGKVKFIVWYDTHKLIKI